MRVLGLNPVTGWFQMNLTKNTRFISSRYSRVNPRSLRPAVPEISCQSEILGARGQAAERRRGGLPCHIEGIPRSLQGMTLIEILLILMLLAIFSSISYRLYSIYKPHPLITKPTESILILKNALKFYKLDNGSYPTTEQGISALVSKPTTSPIPQHWTQYLKTIPFDQWGRPYHYVNRGGVGNEGS